MTSYNSHLSIVAAGTVAEYRVHASHRSRSRIANVVRRVDVPEEHESGRDLGDTFPKRTATHELHLVVLGVGCVEDAIGRPMCDQDVKPLRNLVPKSVDRP